MGRNYWMVVVSTENFHIIKERDFSVYGFRAKLKKRVERMEVGDRMLFYLSREQRFPATVTVTSTMFEDRDPLLNSASGQEEFPCRVHIEPAVVLEELVEEYEEAVQQIPMIARLLSHLGLEIHQVLQTGADLKMQKESYDFNVFHVEEAAGSIPVVVGVQDTSEARVIEFISGPGAKKKKFVEAHARTPGDQ